MTSVVFDPQKRYLYTDEFEISMEIVCTSVPGGFYTVNTGPMWLFP